MASESGIVMRAGSYPAPVLVGGDVLLCGLRGALRPKAAEEPNFLVAGDRVAVARTSPGEGIIMGRLERRTWFARRAAETTRRTRGQREQVLAANLDVVVIVQAAYWPDFRPARVDRYLLAARRGGVGAAVAVNKVDALPPEERDACRAALAATAEEVPVLWTSAVSGEGLAPLGALVAGRTAAFVGSSGVGKSSLIQALDPAIERRTQAIRERVARGRHTTTAAELVPFARGGFLVDTPGLRAFGLAAGGREELLGTFPDVAALADGCRFRDCRHEREPACAVSAAAHDGRLDAARLQSFRKLQRELGL